MTHGDDTRDAAEIVWSAWCVLGAIVGVACLLVGAAIGRML